MTVRSLRWLIGSVSMFLLILVFVFQDHGMARMIGITSETASFVLNKSSRFLVNDICMIGIIYALFEHKRYLYFALIVQAFGIVFILVPYFVLKLYFHSSNGPLVSFLHRLVLNPTLMILLIPAFWFQSRPIEK